MNIQPWFKPLHCIGRGLSALVCFSQFSLQIQFSCQRFLLRSFPLLHLKPFHCSLFTRPILRNGPTVSVCVSVITSTFTLYDALDHADHTFSKALGPRISKLVFPSVSYKNTQIQTHKYTNRQIQHMTKCQKDPTCGKFLKRGLFKDIKKFIPMCRTHKYKNTITQIHKYTFLFN